MWNRSNTALRSPRSAAGWLPLVLGALCVAALGQSCDDDDEGTIVSGRVGICGDGCDLGKVCDQALGCVECLGDSDCGALVCLGGKCEDCRTGDECPTGQSCFPRDHKCEAPCATDADCGKDEELCDVATGACVACMSADDCGGGDPVCDGLRGQCVQCATDSDCGSQYCSPKDNKCAQCVIDAHCPDIRPRCDGKECKAVCTSDLDCDGDKPSCNIDHGHCHECAVDAQCGVESPICKDESKCVGCLADADCAEGYCDHDKCVECTEDSHCADPAFAKCDKGGCVAE